MIQGGERLQAAAAAAAAFLPFLFQETHGTKIYNIYESVKAHARLRKGIQMRKERERESERGRNLQVLQVKPSELQYL